MADFWFDRREFAMLNSRRSTVIYSLLLLIGCFGTALAEKKAKVLFIGKEPDHPWGTHMYLPTSEMLAKCVRLTPGIETVVSNGWPKDPAVLRDVSTIVIYTTPAAEFLLDAPHRPQVEQLMKKELLVSKKLPQVVAL